MSRIALIIVSVFVCVLSISQAIALAGPKASIPAVATDSPPPVNGNVNDALWRRGAHVALYDEFNFRKGIEGEKTDVYVLVDAHFLYVGWIAHQNVPVVEQTISNDGSVGSDDWVQVLLWPGDPRGYSYSFTVTPRGAHTESSSENTAFAPQWKSAARKTADGYEVTMRIPLNVLHAGTGVWHISFLRNVSNEGLLTIWPFDHAEDSAGDVRYSAVFSGVKKIVTVRASRPVPRVQVYGLTQIGSSASGGFKSHGGADFSVPVGPGAIFGTVYPDYSEVEADQQSIAPTEFQRYYNEVRPFFTQAANFYNPTGITDLYTPAIPTPKYGLAFEQSHGGLNLAGFNAIGVNRNDNAQIVNFESVPQTFGAAFQRTSVRMPGLQDLTQSVSLSFGNGKHFNSYAAFGEDAGTNIADASQANYRLFGASLFGVNESLGFNIISIGRYYNPVDGFIPQPGIAGYNASMAKSFTNRANARIQTIAFYANVEKYHNDSGLVNQIDMVGNAIITNRHKLTFGLSAGNSESLNGAQMLPFNANYMYLSDQANPAFNGYAAYTHGRYLDGYARDVDLDWNMSIRTKYTMALERYQTNFTSNALGNAVQSLYRFSLAAQFTRTFSFAAGVRTIFGQPPGLLLSPAANATNLTFALNDRIGPWRLYTVYGNSNAFSTQPTLVIKVIKTVEGDIGT